MHITPCLSFLNLLYYLEFFYNRGRQMTIYDIAKEANVSIATVSRVLNGSQTVSAKTREKVVQAMKNLITRPTRLPAV